MVERPVQRAEFDVALPPLADGSVVRGPHRARPPESTD
jgi:hypothetical protein